METFKVAVTCSDESVCILYVTVADAFERHIPEGADEEYIRKHVEKEIAKMDGILIQEGRPSLSWRFMPEEPPEDDYFRDAWTDIPDEGIAVDMVRARKIHMSNIRLARNKKLQLLDIETLKGLDVQEEKQALRDIPSTFDLTVAEDPEELKNLWPIQLKKGE